MALASQDVVIIHLGCQLPDTSAQPTRTIGLETGWSITAPHCPYSVLLPMGFTLPRPLLARAVSSYLTLSPFPALNTGGLLSVALSLGFAISRFPSRMLSGIVFPWSPDFPPFASFQKQQTAITRPTGKNGIGLM